ncbi:MAG TPA: YigZ family protein, partial [Bacteroidales bacterium]|nr:YigZ family protein [Bacteroidales bacterium]
MSDIYRTIASRAEGMYKDKGSKFLSFALPVENVEEIKKILKDFQHQYHDARHVCYAYVLGNEKKDWRANDAGEPSGTAGRPILRQINTRNLTNVLVIVVRYFGGILLGTSGLINAYSEAASDALNHAEI